MTHVDADEFKKAKAAQRLEARGFKDTRVVEGGAEAWAERGYPAVSPWFFALSAFIGTGLVYSGVSNVCGVTMVLACLPWNRDRRPG